MSNKKWSYVNMAADENGKIIFVKVTAYSDESTRKVFYNCVYKVKGFVTLHSIPVLLEKRLTKPFKGLLGKTASEELFSAIRKEHLK